MFANKTLLSSIVVSVIIIGALIVQMATVSSQLEDRDRTIELQTHEIEQHIATVSTQKQEIESKTALLADLNAKILAKSNEVDSLGTQLSVQGNEIAALKADAEGLEQEIALLQSKIDSNEQYVASLSNQLEHSQQSSKRTKISAYSLAIINDERGVVFPIEVEVINSGTGAISVDVSNVQYEDAFQSAVRTAAAVASDYTGESITDKDVIVRIMGDQNEKKMTTIDGGSAGALIAGMLVAALSDRDVNDDVLITGTINPNGTVGRVGSVGEKIEAAIDFGSNTMLVPKAQEVDSEKIVVVGVLDIDDVVKYLVVPR